MLMCDKCGTREATISADGVKREGAKIVAFSFSVDPKGTVPGGANVVPPVDLCPNCIDQLRGQLKATVEAFLRPPPKPVPPPTNPW